MKNSDRIVLVYTGSEVNVQRIKAEMEIQGINPIIKDGFKQGIAAGFGGGIPSAIDIYVDERDVEKAKEIISVVGGNLFS